MKHEYSNGRHSLHFGNEKFNIHTKEAEFLPAAAHPAYGSPDLCLRDPDGNLIELSTYD